MPISNVTYKLIQMIKDAGVLPPQPDVIEFGESNWYGDIPFQQLEQDIDKYVLDEGTKNKLKSEFARCVNALTELGPESTASWDLSRVFFKAFLDYGSYTAVDLGGSPTALKLNLNDPISLDRQYDISISFGTAEHVFNVYQFFKTLHETTKPGGSMIISAPFQGWIDHGFYNFQPTFYYDLAAVNSYNLPLLLYSTESTNDMLQIRDREHVSTLAIQDTFSGNGNLFAVLQKPIGETPFSTPMQGYYDRAVSQTVADAWETNR